MAAHRHQPAPLALDQLDGDAIRSVVQAVVAAGDYGIYPRMERACKAFREALRGRGDADRLRMALRLTRRAQKASPYCLALAHLDLGPLLHGYHEPDQPVPVWSSRTGFDAFCDTIFASLNHADLFHTHWPMPTTPLANDHISLARLSSATAYAHAVQDPVVSILRGAALACGHRHVSDPSVDRVIGLDVAFARRMASNIYGKYQWYYSLAPEHRSRPRFRREWKYRLVPLFARLAGITRFSSCFFNPVWALIIDVAYLCMKNAVVHTLFALPDVHPCPTQGLRIWGLSTGHRLPTDGRSHLSADEEEDDEEDEDEEEEEEDEDEHSDTTSDSGDSSLSEHTYMDENTVEMEQYERQCLQNEDQHHMLVEHVDPMDGRRRLALAPTADAFEKGALGPRDHFRITEQTELQQRYYTHLATHPEARQPETGNEHAD